MNLSRISELVHRFKCECKSLGWKASQYEDWIRVDGEYHNFLWTRTIRPAAFKKIVEERKCAIHQGTVYQVVDVDYIAWLFSESPSEAILRIVEKNSDLSRSIAVYDMSWIDSDNPTCFKLNRTSSRVFQKFEAFLEEVLEIDVSPVEALLSQQR